MDDNYVSSDKIGTGNYFWAFPGSQGAQAKKQLDEARANLKRAQDRLAKAKVAEQEAKAGREDTDGARAAKAAGGFVEGTLCYTGDVTSSKKYDLDYYLDLATRMIDLGVHALAIKDMAGLLTPRSATVLVEALRQKFPDTPIHVHTHDSAGLGVASMLAASQAGADIVDGAVDAMSGLTSQPSLGAIAEAVPEVGLDGDAYAKVSSYWDDVRATLYAPFESGQLATASDVHSHEIPGGQYTNLLFQSRQLGLDGQFDAVKVAYAAANRLLGDIPKVTPSSKVVGDLAQFMVANKLREEDVDTEHWVGKLPDLSLIHI